MSRKLFCPVLPNAANFLRPVPPKFFSTFILCVAILGTSRVVINHLYSKMLAYCNTVVPNSIIYCILIILIVTSRAFHINKLPNNLQCISDVTKLASGYKVGFVFYFSERSHIAPKDTPTPATYTTSYLIVYLIDLN
jgi:hypothetical protein